MHIFYFSLFAVFNWICHTIIISIIAYFHFFLGHRLTIIDDWIFENAWSISTLSKVLAGALIFKFITVKFSRRYPFRELFGKGIISPSREVLVMITLLLTFFFLYGGGNLDPMDSYNLKHNISSFYGVIFFYGVEIFIVYSINVYYQLSYKKQLSMIPIYALLFIGHNKVTYFYAEGLTILIFFNFAILCFLIFWERLNWTLPVFLMLLYISPAASLLGLDPIWSDRFSAFALKANISAPVYLGINLVPIIYLIYKKKSEEISQLS
ncbi:MAG: hypothetical protein HN576_11435 [Bacteriovoracaceae bacterium]|nr:hypothetical protein [Bacteriovoracaceae bacterium]